MHARTHAHTRTHLGAKEPKTRQHKKTKKKNPHTTRYNTKGGSVQKIFSGQSWIQGRTDKQKLKRRPQMQKTTNQFRRYLQHKAGHCDRQKLKRRPQISSEDIFGTKAGHSDRQTWRIVQFHPINTPTLRYTSVKGTELYKSGIETHRGTASPNLAESCEYVFRVALS